MTSALKDDATRTAYRTFLLKASSWFGYNKPYSGRFAMFNSDSWLEYGNRHRDLMFTDTTKELVDVGEKDTYYKWVGKYLKHCILLCSNTIVYLKEV